MKKSFIKIPRCYESFHNMLQFRAHPKWLPVIIVVIFFPLYGLFLQKYFWGYRHIYNVDLPTFYSASIQVFRHGESSYDRDRLQSLMEPDAHDIQVFPYLYPPPSLLFFYPLAYLDYATARHTVLAFNHLIILILLWIIPGFLLRGSTRTGTFLAFAVTSAYLLTFYPIVVTLNHGQINLLLLVILLAFWLLARGAKPILASLFLALAILLKTYPLILIPLLFANRRRRESVYTIVWLGILTASSALILPSTVWSDWLTEVLPTGGYGRIPTSLFSPAAIWNQSLNGFFARMFTESEWSHPVLVDANLSRYLTYAAAGIVAAVSGAAVWRGSRIHAGGLDQTIMVALPAMYLLAPFSWEHHLVYLLPSILLLLTSRSKMPAWLTVPFYSAGFSSAVILAMANTLQLKFYAVVILWVLCIFTTSTNSIRLSSKSEGRALSLESQAGGWMADERPIYSQHFVSRLVFVLKYWMN